MTQYITNKEETVIKMFSFMPDAYSIDILVGFFYFSGISEILKDSKTRANFIQKDKPIRILVGLNIDKTLHSAIEYASREIKSTNEIEKECSNSIVDFLNSRDFDDKESLEAFFEKIENGSLKIHKTKEPVHAKLYLFQLHEDTNTINSMAMITGSSNLTSAGLKNQVEFNVLESNYDSCKQGQAFFEDLWKDSIPILDVKNVIAIKPKIGLLAKATPYKIFLKVLVEYFSYTNTSNISFSPKNAGFDEYSYQLDSIKRALSAIEVHNGVLLADVVGLGKSVIASCIAKNMYKRGRITDVFVICPPPLIDSWKSYGDSFGLYAKVRSLGQLDRVFEEIKELQRYSLETSKSLIIVDEAHRFRNSKTKDYSYLKEICKNQKVLLLTATPLNNTSSDIFSLVELFQDVHASSINAYSSIDKIKSEIKKDEKKIRNNLDNDEVDTKKELNNIAKKLLGLINPILIRRTRTDLQNNEAYREDLKNQNIAFNKVSAPEIHEYELKELFDLYKNTLNSIASNNIDDDANQPNQTANNDFIESFTAVRYKSLVYLKDDSKEDILSRIYSTDEASEKFIFEASKNLSKFMRRLLVRRFESSIESFRKSLENMIAKYETILSNLEKYDVFVISKKIQNVDVDTLYSSIIDIDYEDDDEENKKASANIISDDFIKKIKEYEYKGIYIIENASSVFDVEFFGLLEKDLAILKKIQSDWVGVKNDYKFDKLLEQITLWQKENDKRKIIIFSEYADTVEYLANKLNKSKVLKYTSQDTSSRNDVVLNFDASVKEEKQKDNYDILVTTDTLSEGINLHRAGIVVNYDIPYNPTRIIQRVGRINRIGKKLFEKIHIHNFIPSSASKDDLNNVEIAKFKLSLINIILGNDTQILDSDEDLKAVFNINDNRMLENDDISWDVEYMNIYDNLKKGNLKDENGKVITYKDIENLPPHLEVQRRTNFDGFIEITRYGQELFYSVKKVGSDKKYYTIQEVFEMLRAEPNEQYYPTGIFLDGYKKEFITFSQRDDRGSKVSHVVLDKLQKLSMEGELTKEQKGYINKIRNDGKNREFGTETLNKMLDVVNSSSGDIEKIINGINDIVNISIRGRRSTAVQLKDANLIVTEEFKNSSSLL